jgi:hypothetical protein
MKIWHELEINILFRDLVVVACRSDQTYNIPIQETFDAIARQETAVSLRGPVSARPWNSILVDGQTSADPVREGKSTAVAKATSTTISVAHANRFATWRWHARNYRRLRGAEHFLHGCVATEHRGEGI